MPTFVANNLRTRGRAALARPYHADQLEARRIVALWLAGTRTAASLLLVAVRSLENN